MDKKIDDYINKLFSSYEETENLLDFKDEIKANLKEKIDHLKKDGLSGDEAFKKATDELGDISKVAEDIGKSKGKEALSDMYVGNRKYIKKSHALSYAVFIGLTIIGIALGLVVMFVPAIEDPTYTLLEGARNALASLSILLSFPISGLVFLGLTQETVANYPMKKGRALAYSIAVFILSFGIFISVVIFLTFKVLSPIDDAAAIALALFGGMVFFIVAIGIFIYLGLTETDRKKLWLKTEIEFAETIIEAKNIKGYANSNRIFKIIQAILWPFVTLTYLVIGILFNAWNPGWLIFIAAVFIQILLGVIFGTNRKQ